MNKTIIAVLSVVVAGLSGWLAVSVATNATVTDTLTTSNTTTIECPEYYQAEEYVNEDVPAEVSVFVGEEGEENATTSEVSVTVTEE